MGLWRWISGSRAREFACARGGNVAMLWALCGVALIGLTGLTVDFTRAQSIRSQLQNAADGAALVAERNSNLSLEERTAAARAFFEAEAGDLASDTAFEVIELPDGGHRVEARYTMDLSLARVIKNEDWVVAVDAEAMASASPPIEVVMVLDNTYSMVNDIDELREAATDLTETLLSIDGDSVSVGLVPFETMVNIGNTHLAWVDTTGVAPLNGEILEQRLITKRSASSAAQCNGYSTVVGTSPYAIRWEYHSSGSTSTRCWGYNPDDGVNHLTLFTLSNTTWKGCVEARPEPYDIQDDAPSSPATLFVPFFWIDDSDNTSGVINNWLNDTTLPSGTIQSGGRTLSVFKYDGTNGAIDETPPFTKGPNRGCPTPITPLTTDEGVITTAIDNMEVISGGGTNSAEGLAWGWRVISPGAPFTEGRDPAQDEVRKVIVLMTDGENTNMDWTSEGDLLESPNNSFGFRGQWTNFQNDVPVEYRRVIGDSEESYVEYVDNRLRHLCTNVKDDDIELYTIVFREPSQDIRTLLQNCASDEEHAFTAEDTSELHDAFDAIGTGIGNLRLTH